MSNENNIRERDRWAGRTQQNVAEAFTFTKDGQQKLVTKYGMNYSKLETIAQEGTYNLFELILAERPTAVEDQPLFTIHLRTKNQSNSKWYRLDMIDFVTFPDPVITVDRDYYDRVTNAWKSLGPVSESFFHNDHGIIKSYQIKQHVLNNLGVFSIFQDTSGRMRKVTKFEISLGIDSDHDDVGLPYKFAPIIGFEYKLENGETHSGMQEYILPCPSTCPESW